MQNVTHGRTKPKCNSQKYEIHLDWPTKPSELASSLEDSDLGALILQRLCQEESTDSASSDDYLERVLRSDLAAPLT
jgi:hypothetical protein